MSARIVSVSGGAAGARNAGVSGWLVVHRAEVLALADRFEQVARAVATLSVRTGSVLGDVHLVESATLAPRSFAEVEGALAVLAAETLACAATWEAAAFGSRELVHTLEAADVASAAAMHDIDQLVAQQALLHLPVAAPLLLADPRLLQRVADGLPVRLVARLLGGWSESGVRVAPGMRTCGRSPRGVADLVARLDQVAEMSDGTIDIETHALAGGRRVHVVYLPGTDQMWSDGFTSDVRDLKENGRILVDEPTAHAVGIEKALALSGVERGEQVLLVGHSQGGMQAAQLLVQGSGFDVTDVVTAGSPVATAGSFPDGSHVLSLENRADIVPALDGAANPATPEHLTVTFDDGPDDPIGSHDLEHYVAGAAAVDESADPAVRAGLTALQPYFAPAEVTSRLFVLTRDVS